MEFQDASNVSAISWQLRTADYKRGTNRAFINDLFNGGPPYSDEEVQENEHVVNYNSLESTRLAHDARSQLANGMLKPGNFFNCKTDAGPKHSRDKHNRIVTAEITRPMKRSLKYFECKRSKFALLILHGIGPAVWKDGDVWCPKPIGVEDLLVPSNTDLTFEGLPFFVLLKSFTAPDLIRMIRSKNVDPGWNKPLVEEVLKYIDKETMALMGSNFPDIWSPEKQAERIKGDEAFYSGDSVPKLDCSDFYYWSDQNNNEGWRRRIVIDDWTSSFSGGAANFSRNPDLKFASGQWLYNSGSRKVADKREELFSCQFADLSAVAPFKYHSVRSLGFLMYGICHVQNRLRCKFLESVFEALTMLFRVKSKDDVQRALKLELVNRGFIDDTISPVPASDRWQVNSNLVELGLRENQTLINDNSSSYTQSTNFSKDSVEKTRYQVMAEVNAMASLVSAGLTQAYQYETFEYREIFRRFCKANSTDPDVRRFQAACLRQGVPEKILRAEAWDIEPEQILGGGNLTRETAIAEWLMQHYDRYEPESQREILRKATFSVTGDPGLSDTLVPETPQISLTIHDTELAFGTLMQGIPVQPAPGINAIEAAGTIIRLMTAKVQQVMQSGIGTPQDLVGLQLAQQYATAFIQRLSQDKEQAPIARQFGNMLGRVMNQVKGLAQRQQEAAEKAAQAGNGGIDAETEAKLKGKMLLDQAKAANLRESHGVRTAQKQVAFELQLKQDAERHAAELAALDLEAAATIERERNTPAKKE